MELEHQQILCLNLQELGFLCVWYGMWTFQWINQLQFGRGTRFWDAVGNKPQALTILPFQQNSTEKKTPPE